VESGKVKLEKRSRNISDKFLIKQTLFQKYTAKDVKNSKANKLKKTYVLVRLRF
jgi:hypothetical protein